MASTTWRANLAIVSKFEREHTAAAAYDIAAVARFGRLAYHNYQLSAAEFAAIAAAPAAHSPVPAPSSAQPAAAVRRTAAAAAAAVRRTAAPASAIPRTLVDGQRRHAPYLVATPSGERARG